MERLSEELSQAIAESPEVGEKLQELRTAGYKLSLLLDCKRSEAEAERAAVRRLPAGEPSFRINAQDLAFLRSVGIDPTRKGRSRRRESP